MTHWHAFAYTGNERPTDSDARDPQSHTPPNTISMWFRKPAAMRVGTFTRARAAHGWLEEELTETPPPQTAVSVAVHLGKAWECLTLEADAYVGYYTTGGGFLVRALLTCPRQGERCPNPPPGTPAPGGHDPGPG